MKITRQLTQEHIDSGKRMSCCSCPLALAINDEVPKDPPRIERASVHPKDGHCTVVLPKEDGTTENWVHRFQLPDQAQRFVAAWEKKEYCQPFEFELELVKSHIRTGATV